MLAGLTLKFLKLLQPIDGPLYWAVCFPFRPCWTSICLHLHCVKSVQIRSFSWSVFSCIRIEYGDLWSKSPYSVRIQKIMDQKKLRIWTIFMQWTVEYSPNLIQFYRRFSTRGTEQCSFVEVSRFWLQGNIRKCSRLSRNGLAATVF